MPSANFNKWCCEGVIESVDELANNLEQWHRSNEGRDYYQVHALPTDAAIAEKRISYVGKYVVFYDIPSGVTVDVRFDREDAPQVRLTQGQSVECFFRDIWITTTGTAAADHIHFIVSAMPFTVSEAGAGATAANQVTQIGIATTSDGLDV